VKIRSVADLRGRKTAFAAPATGRDLARGTPVNMGEGGGRHRRPVDRRTRPPSLTMRTFPYRRRGAIGGFNHSSSRVFDGEVKISQTGPWRAIRKGDSMVMGAQRRGRPFFDRDGHRARGFIACNMAPA